MSSEQEITLRRAWTEVISAEDYDSHMTRVGQAQANAELVRSVLEKWPAPGTTLLFAGAGTGQMFDYADPIFLNRYDVLFTDIRPSFLERLRERLGDSPYRTEIDNLENTMLTGPFGGAVTVLVLEHIDWRKGVASLGKLRAERYYIVIQEDPPGLVPRPLTGTMAVLHDVETRLVPEQELIREMADWNCSLIARESCDVPDGKKMIALIFDQAARGTYP